MKKITKKHKDKIIEFLNWCDWLFDLNNYNRTIKFSKKEHDSWDLVCATMSTDHKYRRFTMKIFPCFFEDDLEEQCKTLIHELCHSITEWLHDCATNLREWKLVTEREIDFERERVTENMAHLIFSLWNGKKKFLGEAIQKYITK